MLRPPDWVETNEAIAPLYGRLPGDVVSQLLGRVDRTGVPFCRPADRRSDKDEQCRSSNPLYAVRMIVERTSQQVQSGPVSTRMCARATGIRQCDGGSDGGNYFHGARPGSDQWWALPATSADNRIIQSLRRRQGWSMYRDARVGNPWCSH